GRSERRPLRYLDHRSEAGAVLRGRGQGRDRPAARRRKARSRVEGGSVVTTGGARVIHFGLDGGSFGVLDRLASRGVMPEYGQVLRKGGWAVLRSTTPWFTVPGWVTWMTGVPPERHGLIYWTSTSARDYWERGGSSRRFVASSDIA